MRWFLIATVLVSGTGSLLAQNNQPNLPAAPEVYNSATSYGPHGLWESYTETGDGQTIYALWTLKRNRGSGRLELHSLSPANTRASRYVGVAEGLLSTDYKNRNVSPKVWSFLVGLNPSVVSGQIKGSTLTFDAGSSGTMTLDWYDWRRMEGKIALPDWNDLEREVWLSQMGRSTFPPGFLRPVRTVWARVEPKIHKVSPSKISLAPVNGVTGTVAIEVRGEALPLPRLLIEEYPEVVSFADPRISVYRWESRPDRKLLTLYIQRAEGIEQGLKEFSVGGRRSPFPLIVTDGTASLDFVSAGREVGTSSAIHEIALGEQARVSLTRSNVDFDASTHRIRIRNLDHHGSDVILSIASREGASQSTTPQNTRKAVFDTVEAIRVTKSSQSSSTARDSRLLVANIGDRIQAELTDQSGKPLAGSLGLAARVVVVGEPKATFLAFVDHKTGKPTTELDRTDKVRVRLELNRTGGADADQKTVELTSMDSQGLTIRKQLTLYPKTTAESEEAVYQSYALADADPLDFHPGGRLRVRHQSLSAQTQITPQTIELLKPSPDRPTSVKPNDYLAFLVKPSAISSADIILRWQRSSVDGSRADTKPIELKPVRFIAKDVSLEDRFLTPSEEGRYLVKAIAREPDGKRVLAESESAIVDVRQKDTDDRQADRTPFIIEESVPSIVDSTGKFLLKWRTPAFDDDQGDENPANYRVDVLYEDQTLAERVTVPSKPPIKPSEVVETPVHITSPGHYEVRVIATRGGIDWESNIATTSAYDVSIGQALIDVDGKGPYKWDDVIACAGKTIKVNGEIHFTSEFKVEAGIYVKPTLKPGHKLKARAYIPMPVRDKWTTRRDREDIASVTRQPDGPGEGTYFKINHQGDYTPPLIHAGIRRVRYQIGIGDQSRTSGSFFLNPAPAFIKTGSAGRDRTFEQDVAEQLLAIQRRLADSGGLKPGFNENEFATEVERLRGVLRYAAAAAAVMKDEYSTTSYRPFETVDPQEFNAEMARLGDRFQTLKFQLVRPSPDSSRFHLVVGIEKSLLNNGDGVKPVLVTPDFRVGGPRRSFGEYSKENRSHWFVALSKAALGGVGGFGPEGDL